MTNGMLFILAIYILILSIFNASQDVRIKELETRISNIEELNEVQRQINIKQIKATKHILTYLRGE